ncbi:hypothetical protein BKM03_10650 [Pseudomonas avellanae]|uniref:Uncharacterized protein n=1 Tax=Pseudomonas avellanae TaxID=46257 RepID=A0AAD0GMW2_9PSED|nr:hypothetical protein BKM03_10650 [Pseudomonas avellanae]POP76977.1 hypothetical protein CXB34_27220 [Pseudomonas amygdali pv. morsprunorum]
MRNDNLIYRAALRVARRSGRSASSFADAERPFADKSTALRVANRISIVRRSASHAFPDALRPLFATQSAPNCIPHARQGGFSTRLHVRVVRIHALVKSASCRKS